MKLRFRENSVRLRVNRREVNRLAAGNAIEEEVSFPNSATLKYIIEASMNDEPLISFKNGVLRVAAPLTQIRNWAHAEASIGLYFQLPAGESVLRVSIEKDLQCVDGPAAEFDPDAYPRQTGTNC